MVNLTELFFIINDGIIAFAGDQQTSEQWPCFLTRLSNKANREPMLSP